jgi:hypothetical protein
LWLVLCSPRDDSALWAARGLEARGLTPLQVLTPEALACHQRLEHRLGAAPPRVRITLTAGGALEDHAVRGVLNRLEAMPTAHLRGASPADRLYANQELNAMHLSWLHGLPATVLNRPTPQGLGGRWRHVSEWRWLAARAGLATLPYRSTTAAGAAPEPRSSRTIVVAGDGCFGPRIGPSVAAAALALARRSETPVLGLHFAQTPAGWLFADATPQPDLRPGGDALLDALALALRS